MKTLNNNSIKVLIKIRDKENNLGLCQGRGITKDDIVKRSEWSVSTVNRAIKLLLEKGYINEAIKHINKKTYYISEDGMNMLRLLNKQSI